MDRSRTVLDIVMEDDREIKLFGPKISDYEVNGDWYSLLITFQNDLQKLQNTIQDYEFFTILYKENESIEINESAGGESYRIGSNEKLKRKNICSIIGEEYRIIIEFSNASELLENDIAQSINLAIQNVDFNFYQRIIRYQYSFSQGGKPISPYNFDKLKFVVLPGINMGLYKGKVISEVRLGFGLTADKRILSLSGAWLNRYDHSTDRLLNATMVGVSYYRGNSGVEMMFRLSDKNDLLNDDLDRVSFLWKVNSLRLAFHTYIGKPYEVHFGVSAGYGF